MSRRVSLADFTPDTARRRDPAPEPAAEPSPEPSGPAVRDLPLEDIVANPLNARTEADEDPAELERLAATITARGVLQPIVVCSAEAFLEQHPDQREAIGIASWVALIGNRRLAGSRLAGATSIRAVVDVSALGSIDEVMLVENGHRRDLHPLREAEALARFRDAESLTVRDVGERIGYTHGYVVQRLALLKLLPVLRTALEDGTLTFKRARELGGLSEAEQQAVADAGPPWRTVGYPVTNSRRRYVPAGNPAAAARSIRELYSGEELAELVRLLSTEPSR